MARRNTVFAVLAFALAMQIGNARAETKTAIFAGGCFWCVESDFDAVPGVLATTSGYIGGTSRNPTYQDYSAAGHREAVKIDYDSTKVNYATLLDIFWHSVDPTDGGRAVLRPRPQLQHRYIRAECRRPPSGQKVESSDRR